MANPEWSNYAPKEPEKRVLDFTTLRTVSDEIWMEITLPGMLIRLTMTPEELDDLLMVGEQVKDQYNLINKNEEGKSGNIVYNCQQK